MIESYSPGGFPSLKRAKRRASFNIGAWSPRQHREGGTYMEGRREVRTMLAALSEAEASFPGFTVPEPVPPSPEDGDGSDAMTVETRLSAWLSKVDR